jgi:hypothetical protein
MNKQICAAPLFANWALTCKVIATVSAALILIQSAPEIKAYTHITKC